MHHRQKTADFCKEILLFQDGCVVVIAEQVSGQTEIYRLKNLSTYRTRIKLNSNPRDYFVSIPSRRFRFQL